MPGARVYDPPSRHDPEALARAHWVTADTLTPEVRLAARARIHAALLRFERDRDELAEIARLTAAIRAAKQERLRVRLRRDRHRIYARRWARQPDARADRRDWIAANLESVRRSKRDWARRARERRRVAS